MTLIRTKTIGVLAWLDGAAGLVASVLAAALVLIEIIILFTGVVFRYVLNHPLVWSDELAEILFLWLVSFGAVVAYRRDEHMRMTVISGVLPQKVQNFLGRISSLIILLVVGAIVVPGYGYMEQQQAITTPALQIPGSWEIIGELVAFAMLLLCAVYRLFKSATLLDLGVAIAVIAGIGVLFWSLEDVFSNIGNADLVIFFVGVTGLCILAGVPIAFSFGISTITYLFYTSSIPLSVLISQMDQGMSSIELLAVPMFIVLGLLLEMTGIARALVNFLNALVGHKRGGLSYSLIGAMYLVAGISGSKAADQAAIAPVLLPEMKRRGVAPGELVAQLAASAAMSETIPPSLVLIIVGAVTGVSTQALFSGGLLPAGIAALALIAVIAFRTRKDKAQGDKSPPRQTGRLFVISLPALVLPVLIRYAVLAGITTATEVATVGVVYSVLIGIFVYRQFELAPRVCAPDRNGGTFRRYSADHRDRVGHGLGFDTSWVRTGLDHSHDRPAGRTNRLHARLDRAVHHSWQRAGRSAGDGSVRPAAVSHRPAAQHQRRPVRDRRHSGDGNRPLLTAFRRWFLPEQPDRPHAERSGADQNLALYGGHLRGLATGRRHPLAVRTARALTTANAAPRRKGGGVVRAQAFASAGCAAGRPTNIKAISARKLSPPDRHSASYGPP